MTEHQDTSVCPPSQDEEIENRQPQLGKDIVDQPGSTPVGDSKGDAKEGEGPKAQIAVDVHMSSPQKEELADGDAANTSVVESEKGVDSEAEADAQTGSEPRSQSREKASSANDEDEDVICDGVKGGSEIKRTPAGKPPMSRLDTSATRKRVSSARRASLDQESKRKKLEEKERIAEEKRQEKERKEKEREEKKREEEMKKEERRREKEKEKEEKKKEEEERKRKKEEEREAKRREEEELKKKKEEERERKRKEDEEKQLKKRQEEERKEAKRREEEVAQLLEEEKKRRASAKFLSFFKPVEKRVESPAEKEPQTLWFVPYAVRKGAVLAPLLRRECLPEAWQLSEHETSEPSSYLQDIKKKYSSRTPSTAAAAPDFPQKNGAKIEKLKSFRLVPATSTRLLKSKLFHFHTNYRPPYYGTWDQSIPKGLNGRRPLSKGEVLDYEVDSDLEWEEEPEDAEECRSDEEEEGEDEEDDDDEGFFVEPRYLSDGEGESEDEACGAIGEGQDVRAARLAARAREWEQGVRRKKQVLNPTIIGPTYNKPPERCEALMAVIF
ncbi:unnamed protein product, partial [Mesorhabditis spiculigera]